MSQFHDLSPLNYYQFPRWSATSTRPHTSLPSKNASDMFKLGMDNRNLIEISSKKRLVQHNIHIPNGLRVVSPPLLNQPTPTPDICSAVDQLSTTSSITPTPVRIKSAALTIPIKTNFKEILSKNFPKQTHERRKITQERKRKKQQAQKHALENSDNWFQLRQSLAELKRLTTTEEIFVDPTTSLFTYDGYSYEALKQTIHEQQEQKKVNKFKSESGMSSSMDTIRSSFNNRSRTSLAISQNSLSHSRKIRPSTQIYPHSIFEPLLVAAKPLHPLLLTGNNRSLKTKTKQIKPPSSAPPRVRFPYSSSSFAETRAQLTLSDLSNHVDTSISLTPSPQLQYVKEDEEEEILTKTSNLSISDYQKPLANISLKSTIKLKSQMPRCRSANDAFLLNKTYPRFILITDEEHRVESWYHQYPFILSDDLIQSFQSKPAKSTVLAYFIDDHQQLYNSNLINKTYLQGKPFHINDDWKKYDLIFISNNIYQQIMIYLQTIIKLSGKSIHIYQINHNEDLKSQVKYISRQLYQQMLSHLKNENLHENRERTNDPNTLKGNRRSSKHQSKKFGAIFRPIPPSSFMPFNGKLFYTKYGAPYYLSKYVPSPISFNPFGVTQAPPTSFSLVWSNGVSPFNDQSPFQQQQPLNMYQQNG